MTSHEDPNAHLEHTDLGDRIELSWTEKGNRQTHFTVERATGEATPGTGDTVTAADGRVLQLALNQIGESELGATVFDRYSR